MFIAIKIVTDMVDVKNTCCKQEAIRNNRRRIKIINHSLFHSNLWWLRYVVASGWLAGQRETRDEVVTVCVECGRRRQVGWVWWRWVTVGCKCLGAIVTMCIVGVGTCQEQLASVIILLASVTSGVYPQGRFSPYIRSGPTYFISLCKDVKSGGQLPSFAHFCEGFSG